MNRAVLCGMIFSAVIIGAVISLVKVNHSTEHFLELIDNIAAVYENGDPVKAEEKISELEKDWEDHYKSLSFLVPSGVLGDISCEIAGLRYLCRSRTDDFLAECLCIRSRLTLVYESQLPKLFALL